MSDSLNLDDAIASKIEALLKERLGGFVEKLEEAAASLREALGEGGGSSKGKVKGRRGRPVGSGKMSGAKPGPKKKGGKNAPRGALDEAIKGVLLASKEPVGLGVIRDGVIKTEHFKDRDGQKLYTQISNQMKTLAKKKLVQKNEAKEYVWIGKEEAEAAEKKPKAKKSERAKKSV